MATYPMCINCGNDLLTHDEQEQNCCFGCQKYLREQDLIEESAGAKLEKEE